MSNHDSSEGSAITTRGDSIVRGGGGEQSLHNLTSQVDNLRSEPGQGLGDHFNRFKTADLAGQGFGSFQLFDGERSLTDGQSNLGLNATTLGGRDQSLVQEAAYRPKNSTTAPADDGNHVCHVNPGEQPFQKGVASIFQEREGTATGETNDPTKHTAASKELPLNSKACVTRDGETEGTEVRINDRGPYVKGRVIDMTPAAAGDIGIHDGTGKVNIYRPGSYEK